MENLEQLINSAQHGDSEAFNQLYEYSFSTVKTECLKVLHNSLDAEDAIQETYIRIYKRLSSLKDPSKFLGWCRMIAHNCSVDYIAHHQRKAGKDDYKPPVSYDDYSGMDQVNLEDTELTPAEQAEQKMVRALLQEAMDSIPPQRATCLALYQQGNSYKEISAILAIPLGTVKSNVYYAKSALKQVIEKIEREENVQVHAFTLIPIAGKVKVRIDSPDNESFIHSEPAQPSAMKEDIWEGISKGISKSSKVPIASWKKITAVVLSLAVIVGGIVFAVNRAGQTDFHRPASHEEQVGKGKDNKSLGKTVPGDSPRNSSILEPGDNASIYLNQDSPGIFSVVNELQSDAQRIIENSIRGQLSGNYKASVEIVGNDEWNKNSLIVLLWVAEDYIDYIETHYVENDPSYPGHTREIGVEIENPNHSQGYYTYVKFTNIYKKGNKIYYEKSYYPANHLIVDYTDLSGEKHYVAGFKTSSEALQAGINHKD